MAVNALLAALSGGGEVLFGAGVAGKALEGANVCSSHHDRLVSAVRGYLVARRIGDYSHAPEDVNTYGLSRNKFGATSSFREPFSDRQTSAGPFNHGFFFDWGTAPRGEDSPYLH
jgi:hypothetical protein